MAENDPTNQDTLYNQPDELARPLQDTPTQAGNTPRPTPEPTIQVNQRPTGQQPIINGEPPSNAGIPPARNQSSYNEYDNIQGRGNPAQYQQTPYNPTTQYRPVPNQPVERSNADPYAPNSGIYPPPEPKDYYQQQPPVNVPPHRRPQQNYRPYQPPPRYNPNYQQPNYTPADDDDYDYEYPPPQSYTISGGYNEWGRPVIRQAPEPRRAWLIPLLVVLLLLMIASGVVLFLLFSTKNNSNNQQPVVVVSRPTSTVAPISAITSAVSTATTAPQMSGTPTSTPGASAPTQLAELNATATAQAQVTPATSSATTITPVATATGNLATVTPEVSPSPSAANSSVEQLYQTGLQAVNQAQWQTAITALELVEAGQPQYKDTESLLVQAYAEQGKANVNDAASAQDVLAAKQYFDKALALRPNDSNLKKLEQELNLYYNGRNAYDNGQWAQAVSNFANLYSQESGYKDTLQLLYNSYINQGDLLTTQNKLPEALAIYKNAAMLPVSDNSEAQQKAGALQQQLQATATPLPTATPIPTPTQVLINGCPVNTYNFASWKIVDATGGTDQGRSTVQGIVLDLNKEPLAGVGIKISSSNGRYSFAATTDNNGRYSFSGIIGHDTWKVSVSSVPNIQICASFAAKVNVSGQAGAQAEVDFVQTRP